LQGGLRCPRRGDLAKVALVARVNGTLQDLDRPLECDTDLELLDFSTPEGREHNPFQLQQLQEVTAPTATVYR
ncbi:hypothetical protein DV515_00016941, partial [Chloebia gouldiae]